MDSGTKTRNIFRQDWPVSGSNFDPGVRAYEIRHLIIIKDVLVSVHCAYFRGWNVVVIFKSFIHRSFVEILRLFSCTSG